MSEMTINTKKAVRTMAMVGIVLALFSSVAMADIRLDVPVYDQGDKTWAGDQLGSCDNTTIKSAGCAITSIAMVFKYYGVDTDPQDMNNWSIENGGYSGGCNVKWDIADERSNGIVDWIGDPSASLDRIKSELNNRYPVIAKVMIPLKSGGETGHYVVITGYSEIKSGSKINTTLYINDPVGGVKETIPSTSNKRYPDSPEKEVKKIRLYHGPVIQITDQSIFPTIAKAGDELTFVYNINNPLDEVPKIRLGAQIRTNNPQGEWIDDVSNDKVVDLVSGVNDYSRLFKLPLDLKLGFYDARWVLIDELTKKPINSKEMIRIFEIQAEDSTLPKLDLIFLIDTTGSMQDDIAYVKESANKIVNALDSKEIDYRVAVADYRDYPCCGYGGLIDYVYNLNLPFSNDKDAIVDSINGLTLGWGADWRESVYSALVESMTNASKDTTRAGNYGWREGVTKAIIIMADAPPHDPEPWIWDDAYALSDVIYWSENIDPIMVYSVVIGNDSTTYTAFSKISEGTGGKVYSAPKASDVVGAIIEAIGDIEVDSYGVEVKITPTQNETSPGDLVVYSVNITNQGNVTDIYNVSFRAENIVGHCRGYPLDIQYSWIMFNNSTMELDPSISEIRPLAISVPEDWAGMEDVIYTFSVSAKSQTDKAVGNRSSAELKVKANKRSMIEYSKLEIQWLSELVNGSSIDPGIKNALLKKLTNAESKADKALANLGDGKPKIANNMLKVSRNAVNAFANQVEAQYDKKIMQPDAVTLREKAEQIMEDIKKAENAT